MTGKKEENSIETLLADLKTTIKLDLEDKDEPDSRIGDVYKDLVRKNHAHLESSGHKVDTAVTMTTTSSVSVVEEEEEDRVGYVMDIITTPPTPSTVNTPATTNHQAINHSPADDHRAASGTNHSPDPGHMMNHTDHHTHGRGSRSGNRSESQSTSSQCDSHLCGSCDSAGYDTDSSLDSQKRSATLKPAPSSRINHPFSTIQPLHMQLHQTSNRGHRDPLFHDECSKALPRSNGGPAAPPGSILRRPRDKDGTTSETTSGVSSQDMKIRFVTSDSETQTEADPSSVKSLTDLDTPLPINPQNQTIFHLDKYTHLTKRKRSKGIPNVCTWFGMSAVEHLIQNTVNCNSWLWTNPNRAPSSTCNSNSGSSTTLMKTGCNATPQTVRLSPAPAPYPSAPVMLSHVREWDSEKSLLEAMSDIGEQFLENISPGNSRKGSRRGSQISLADFNSPIPTKKKTKSGKRLLVPGGMGSSLSNFKDSIIAQCRSPRSVKKRSEQLELIENGKSSQTISRQNGNMMTSTFSNLSSSSGKSKEEDEEEKKKEDSMQAAVKNATLLELLDEDGGFGDDNFEEKKKSRAKKAGGGGGGGRFRGGNTMMKCAMFDEVVHHHRKEDESVMEDPRRQGRVDNHHAWRNAFRSEMRTKAFHDSQFEEVAKDLEKNTEKLEELQDEARAQSQSQEQKAVNRWKSKVENSRTDKKLTKDRSDEPPKLAKKEGKMSSENAAKKWKSKIGGAGSQNQIRRQPPSAASARWSAARSKTLAVNKLGSISKQPGGGGGASLPSRAGSAMPNKPMQSNSAPSSLMSRSASTYANRPSALQSNSTKSTFPSSTASKPGISGPKATWQKAAMKTKSVNNFSKPTSAVGAKKPYVPYKPPAKQAAGVKPGFGGSRKGSGGPAKFGGGKMGGRMF